jgi:PAS domain S-box-containing protein
VWVPHASGDLRLLSILISPKLDTEGKVEYVVCSAEDITERTLAEHERTQAYTILENSPILAWVVNIKEKRTEYCNSGLEKFFGKILSEMNADPQFWKEHIHPDDKEKLIESSIATLFPEGKVSGEYRVGPYNSDQWLMTTLQLVKDERGSPTHMIGVSLDITERKRIEGALQIANKKLQLLTSITRHDILNQMMALQGYILGSQSNSTTI